MYDYNYCISKYKYGYILILVLVGYISFVNDVKAGVYDAKTNDTQHIGIICLINSIHVPITCK